ncbi:MAG: hypothetical protein HKO02_10485 [Hyphomonadaceae bacterium]|nr:hypothetical protein [Hyphomonadaceae bacterium]
MVTKSVAQVFKLSPNLTRKPRSRRYSLTVSYLKRKLKRLDRRIARDKARDIDYIQRERVAAQLEDAKKFR